jgi:hypothetical protein
LLIGVFTPARWSVLPCREYVGFDTAVGFPVRASLFPFIG